MAASRLFRQHLGNNLVQRASIGVGVKQCFAMIAAQDDVVTATGDMQSRKSGHPSHRE
jgi:hypothetical protein